MTSDQIQREVRFVLATVLGHFAVNGAHGVAHRALAIPLAQSQKLFILVVILLAPALAAALVWKGAHRSGGLLLAASLVGAVLFGVWNHYVAISPDHISHLPATGQPEWKVLFQVTALLLIPTEGCGIWAAVRLLRRAW